MSNTREEGKRDPLGHRTQLMHAHFEEKEWPIISVGNEHYLEINGTKYRIVDGGVTDFLNEYLVSIGAGLGRELITLMQHSPTLEDSYQSLKNKVKTLPKDAPTESILKLTVKFVRDRLDADAKVDLDKAVEDFCAKKAADPKALKYKEHPVITIGEFVREKKGVCRHHALLLCNMLNRLMVDQLLPEGEIHHTRDDITDRGAHVWVIYIPKNSSAIYLVDSL